MFSSPCDDFRGAQAFYDLDVAQSSRRHEIAFNRVGAGALYRAASATMVKHEPRPSAERTSTRCPSTSAACFTMKSPSPSPSARLSSARWKARKIIDNALARMPTPVSRTSMRSSEPKRREATDTEPPEDV